MNVVERNRATGREGGGGVEMQEEGGRKRRRKAWGDFWYSRVRPSFLEAKNSIPHKKFTASGTNRFDRDMYCK